MNASVDASEFAKFAADRAEIWTHVRNTTVEHKTLGPGTVEAVFERPLYIPLLSIQFETIRAQTFNTDAFRNGAFSTILLPAALISQFDAWRVAEEKALEAKAAEQERLKPFKLLAKKYKVFVRDEWQSTLFPVLQALENCEELDSSMLVWLRDQGHFRILAIYHYRRYSTRKDLWGLVMACSNLRHAKQSSEAIKLASSHISKNVDEDSKVFAALLTTRGAAFRDLRRSTDSEHDAQRAIQAWSHDPHPYNLLGAICYDRGEYIKGDAHFDKALQLGGSERDRDRDIRSAFRSAAPADRERMATHLLSKDARRYAWVQEIRE